MADHYLIVPPLGLLEVIHADHPLDPEGVLRGRTSGGEFIRLASAGVTAYWLSNQYGQMNPRARETFARVSKVHLVFTGPVIFEGIEENLMGEIVGILSLRDTARDGTP